MLKISKVDPTKRFFFGNEDFFRFLLLSLAIVQYTHFFHMLQTLKLNSKNRKTGKKESLVGSTPEQKVPRLTERH